MKESWRPIEGTSGLYEVSDLGRVRSYATPWGWRLDSPRVMKLREGARGYLLVRFGQEKTSRPVHVLVMAAFVGPRPEAMEVRHLDGHKTNNRLTNLAYGSRSENARDVVRHGKHRNQNTGRQECHNGHPFTEENTRILDGGKRRRCRKCACEWERQYRLKRKALV